MNFLSRQPFCLKPTSLSKWLLLSLLFLQLNGCAQDKEEHLGKAIYLKYCKSCHGKEGDKGLSGAANLKTSLLDQALRVQVITEGSRKMSGYKNTLTKEQIYDVAEYLEELKDGD